MKLEHFNTSRAAKSSCTANVPVVFRTRVSLLLIMTGIVSCTHNLPGNDLSMLDNKRIPIVDEAVESSLEKAMQGYRDYLDKARDTEKTPEVMRRLADLEVTNSYAIPGPDSATGDSATSAIDHYIRLLADYPMYDYRDHVLYQLSRAYKSTGQHDKAMSTLELLTVSSPYFEHIDEVYFRLGEHYFSNRMYKQSTRAYSAVLEHGRDSTLYHAALNKLAWAYFKQDNYRKSLSIFISSLELLLDTHSSSGDLEDVHESREYQDSMRAASLCLSYLGGADAITAHTRENDLGKYRPDLYRSLAEFYLEKKRFSDAAKTYRSFIDKYPDDAQSPYYSMAIIGIYQKAGFSDIEIEARAQFAHDYSKHSGFSSDSSMADHPEIHVFQKSNIATLASHYHALYRNAGSSPGKDYYYNRAAHWYSDFYSRFPSDKRTPQIGTLLAELHLENTAYRKAALTFERNANNYPESGIAAKSSYAAIFAYREHLKTQPIENSNSIREDIVASSLNFADSFPSSPESPAVLTAAAHDMIVLRNYSAAADISRRVTTTYNSSDKGLLCTAWTILGDASFELAEYHEAENAYLNALALASVDLTVRKPLTDNLAVSIYEQGVHARADGRHVDAADHFLRIMAAAPTASMPDTLLYDAAIELVAAEEWSRAAEVLETFRSTYLSHELYGVTSRNLAVIYSKSGNSLKSAREYERIELSDNDIDISRDALLQAGAAYRKANRPDDALRVYKRYIKIFPRPVGDAIEAHNNIADIYKSGNDTDNHIAYLKKVIEADRHAGDERNFRTRQLASSATLELAQYEFDSFRDIELTRPFKRNLDLKKSRMESSLKLLRDLLNYQLESTTSAATFYIAEIYLIFSKALADSERPDNLDILEMEEYELALEEQIYQFEEKAISIFEKNTELLDTGIYDPWVTKSIDRLSELSPARYAKQEQVSGFLRTLFTQYDRI